MLRASAFAILLLLPGCGDDRPPGPTAEQSDQLNEAENLLNEQAEADQGAPPAE